MPLWMTRREAESCFVVASPPQPRPGPARPGPARPRPARPGPARHGPAGSGPVLVLLSRRGYARSPEGS